MSLRNDALSVVHSNDFFLTFQLIGGAVTPSVFSQAQSSTSHGSSTIGMAGVSPNLMIGDYVQGNLGNVLGNAFRQ